MVLLALLLTAAGFTAEGIAAGSFAALVQSVFYGGGTCGIFSILQSAAATGGFSIIGAILDAIIVGLLGLLF